jgi:hypothetical protein
MEFSQTTFVDNPEYNQIVFDSKIGNTRVEIGSFDKDGEVEFFVTELGETTTFFLTRENVQQLMSHFKNQL